MTLPIVLFAYVDSCASNIESMYYHNRCFVAAQVSGLMFVKHKGRNLAKTLLPN